MRTQLSRILILTPLWKIYHVISQQFCILLVALRTCLPIYNLVCRIIGYNTYTSVVDFHRDRDIGGQALEDPLLCGDICAERGF